MLRKTNKWCQTKFVLQMKMELAKIFSYIAIYDTPIMIYPIELFPYQCVIKFSAQTFSDSMSIAGWPNLFIMISRSEEHTSELQSHSDLVCRLLLEKKKPIYPPLNVLP